MTKQIAVVNLSNWDGEDYHVRVKDGDHEKRCILRPGEHTTVTHGNDVIVELTDEDNGDAKPFRVATGYDGDDLESFSQTFPIMRVDWEMYGRGEIMPELMLLPNENTTEEGENS